MEVSERKRKLDGERKYCDPCAKFDVRSHPLHADNAPHAGNRTSPPAPTLQHNIASAALMSTGCVRKQFVNSERARPRAGVRTQASQRPSRSQVAANAPSSSNKPIRPVKTGKTPTPLTTLASRIF